MTVKSMYRQQQIFEIWLDWWLLVQIAAVVQIRRMTMPPGIELIAELEERLLHVWPAAQTHMIDGWAIRFAGGYTGRANSASAITPGARMTDALLDQIIAMYKQAGLVPQVRVSPGAHADTALVLNQRGFISRGLAHTMTAQIDHLEVFADRRVTLISTADRSWCINVTSRQDDPAKRNPDGLEAIVNRITLPVRFATVTSGADAVGFGMVVVDGTWVELGSVVIDAQHRGKGLGRAMLTTLLHWAKAECATQAFLQVDVTNIAALALYRSLGFAVLYDYDTLFLKGDTVNPVRAPLSTPCPAAPVRMPAVHPPMSCDG